ncbi:hypothetical protein F7725_001210, partial [Dissostichus mawsoni]
WKHGLVSAQVTVYSGTEGENNQKFFCKEPCEQEDILIETTDATAQRGRYRIDYKDGGFFVTITQLNKSDSGRYRCGADTSLNRLYTGILRSSLWIVTMLDGDPSAENTIDARTGGNIAVRCNFTQYRAKKYFCKEECEGDNLVETTTKSDQENGRYRIRYTQIIPTGYLLFVSIDQLTQSDSGWYRCGLGRTSSKDPYQRFRLIVTDALTTSPKTTEQPETTKGVILYVRLTLVVLVIVSSLSVLVFCRKRICKAKSEEPEPHVETQCASAPEAEDDPSQHAYSEIKFVSVGSSHSGFHGDAECVSTLFLGWKLALMSPLCNLLLTTPNNSHSLAEEAALQDGSTGLVSAQVTVYSGTEGENVRVECSFPSYRIRKFFCKEPCEQEDILIETTDATAQRGRYRIDYKDGAMLDGDPSAENTIDARTGGNIAVRCNFTQYRAKKYFCKEECEGDNLVETTTKSDQENGRYRIRYTQIIPTGYLLFVSIDQLTQSDSGWYRCGLGRTSSKDPYQRFRLIVTDALTTSPKTTEQPETTKGVILYVRLTLVVLVIVSSLSVLVFCRKRICKAKSEEPEPHVETQCASAPELKTTRVNTPTLRSNLSASARPTAVSTVTLSVFSTLFLGWKLALMSPLCNLLLTTPNNSHSLAEEAALTTSPKTTEQPETTKEPHVETQCASAPEDGSTGLVSAQVTVYSGTEGENVRVECSFPSYRIRKFFCKEPCEQEDILIETTDATAQRGRYRIDYKDGGFFVTITQLNKSDSGRYAMLDGDPSAENTIDARTGGNIAVRCNFTQYRAKKYFCKEECKKDDNLVETTSKSDQENGRYRIRYTQIIPTGYLLYVSIDQLTQSDSGWYRCGLGRPDPKDPYQRFRLIVTDALTTSPKTTEQPETTKATGVILYVSLTLVVLVIVSSLSVLVFCRKRTCKAKNDPSQHTYSEIKSVASARPTAVSTVTLSVFSTLFLGWKLALMRPLCTLLLTTPNNSHSLAEEAGVN